MSVLQSILLIAVPGGHPRPFGASDPESDMAALLIAVIMLPILAGFLVLMGMIRVDPRSAVR